MGTEDLDRPVLMRGTISSLIIPAYTCLYKVIISAGRISAESNSHHPHMADD